MRIVCSWLDDEYGEAIVVSPCCGGLYPIPSDPDRNPISFLCRLTQDGVALGFFSMPNKRGESHPVWIPMRVCPCCGSPFEIVNQGLEEILTAKED